MGAPAPAQGRLPRLGQRSTKIGKILKMIFRLPRGRPIRANTGGLYSITTWVLVGVGDPVTNSLLN